MCEKRVGAWRSGREASRNACTCLISSISMSWFVTTTICKRNPPLPHPLLPQRRDILTKKDMESFGRRWNHRLWHSSAPRPQETDRDGGGRRENGAERRNMRQTAPGSPTRLQISQHPSDLSHAFIHLHFTWMHLENQRRRWWKLGNIYIYIFFFSRNKDAFLN